MKRATRGPDIPVPPDNLLRFDPTQWGDGDPETEREFFDRASRWRRDLMAWGDAQDWPTGRLVLLRHSHHEPERAWSAWRAGWGCRMKRANTRAEQPAVPDALREFHPADWQLPNGQPITTPGELRRRAAAWSAARNKWATENGEWTRHGVLDRARLDRHIRLWAASIDPGTRDGADR